MKSNRHSFSIRSLLILTGVMFLAVMLVAQPRRNANEVMAVISNAKMIGGNEYLDDAARSTLNAKIRLQSAHIPECTHSFKCRVMQKTDWDFVLFRQPVIIEFTANPIPPKWQGEIVRHRKKFYAGLVELTLAEESREVLYEYWD